MPSVETTRSALSLDHSGTALNLAQRNAGKADTGSRVDPMSLVMVFDKGVSGKPRAPEVSQLHSAPRYDEFMIEIAALDRLADLKTEWADLISRALEPNIFLEPAFAIPLYQHCDGNNKTCFLLAWGKENDGSHHRLLGLLPLTLPRIPIAAFARGAAHKHAPLGMPLFDRDHSPETLAQLVDWLGRHFPHLAALHFSHLPRQGATFALLQHFAQIREKRLYLSNTYERAALISASPDAARSAKRRKQYRQQKRRLGEKGAINYRSSGDPQEISIAAENYMSLESQGWKGKSKTALRANSSDAAFFRSMTQLMAREGKCRIDSLELGGAPAAMGIVLTSGGRAHYWKTTYDERYAVLSPGVQLTLELTRIQLASPAVTLTDSCAVPDHPMINRIWKDRIAMTDVILPLHRTQGLSFKLGLYRDRLYHALHLMAKQLVNRLRR